jgi:hypothetical protein
MKTRTTHLFLIALVASSLGAWGCGSDDDDSVGVNGGSGGASGGTGGSAGGGMGSTDETGGTGGGTTGGTGGTGGTTGETDLSGSWEGSAAVEGTMYLQSGVFPVKLHLTQSGQKVRGVLDVNQDAAFMAEWFGYYVEGTISGSVVEIEMSDRNCGAGEPQALCAPRWGEGHTKVFKASLALDGTGLSGEAPTILPGIDYPDDVPIELPYANIDLELKTAPVDGPDDSSLAGTWKGPFNPPYSVVYGGGRLFGVNTVVFENIGGEMALVRFDNNDVNVYPTHADIVLAHTFKYDDSTKRFWFKEAGSIYGGWLWIGELRGDALVGHFVSTDNDPELDIWQEDQAAVDPFTVPFLNFEATFQFNRQ